MIRTRPLRLHGITPRPAKEEDTTVVVAKADQHSDPCTYRPRTVVAWSLPDVHASFPPTSMMVVL